MVTTQKQLMLAGEMYQPGDPEIRADAARCFDWLVRYNQMLAVPAAERRGMLAELFAEVGEGAVVRPPFHCDFGFNIHLGAHVFLNFNCVILDVTTVTIGERTQIGPGVQILTADHPRDPAQREAGMEFARPIIIGRNVWIGGGALIMPGVTIGDDAVIGAGSVVTRDVSPGATAVGNPARPLAKPPR
ncbi:MAG: sugar O-acetyltransferase [Methylobacterium sp.]|uniref:sugar O-acetyltransferase n=1 Tax=Methylobacterium sp. TaxID=409 RepID=UPI0025ECFF48|nr:sugar O-acetyltransferase [Methylobacterium sp.]MBX9932803.1 sugar O-acetyltransferase [Methylobacterium sp.]